MADFKDGQDEVVCMYEILTSETLYSPLDLYMRSFFEEPDGHGQQKGACFLRCAQERGLARQVSEADTDRYQHTSGQSRRVLGHLDVGECACQNLNISVKCLELTAADMPFRSR